MNEQYLYQPREISIETLALCNAACEFCPYPTLERQGTKLPDADFLAMLSQMKQWTEPFWISPFKVNEPYLDKRLLAFCRYINEDLPRAKLRLFTNGSRFTKDNIAETLALKNVEHIWISLNEVDPVRYKEVMKYVALEHVAEKIDQLHAAMLGGRRQRVVVSRVCCSNSDRDERESRARKAFESYVVQRWPLFSAFNIKRDGWLGYTAPSSGQIPNSPCARWWELNICATGDVALCCMDGKAEYKVGNIREKSLHEIYNQPMLLRRRMGAEQRSRIEPCGRCTY